MWLGEPFGTLVLTMAVTIIELALIISMMLSGKPNPALARDSVHAVVMLVLNGQMGVAPMLADFFAPVLVGNIIGGTALFALIAYAQVMREI